MTDAADLELLKALSADDSVQLYYACKKINHSDSRLVTLRLIEILDDPTDWDHHHYPAEEALAALGRIDPTAWCWMEPAAKAIQMHRDCNHLQLAQHMFTAVRRVLRVEQFLDWAKQLVREPTRSDDSWIVSILNWCKCPWYDDAQFIDELLAVLSEPDKSDVIRELLIYEEGLLSLGRSSPAFGIAKSEAEKIQRWTRNAPSALRAAAIERAEQLHRNGPHINF